MRDSPRPRAHLLHGEHRPALTPIPPPPAASTHAPARPGDAVAIVAVAAGLAGLALYASTAAPGVQGGDSGEFQFVGYVLGIPHPPGYPLYAVLTKLWTLLVPFGEVARRVNLMSAVFAAATLGAVGWAGCRAFGGRWAGATAGLVAAAWLAVAPTWWGQATIASVRPPTGFFLAAPLALLASYGATRDRRWLYAAAALYGLGLTHHISLYTFAPALVLYVVVTTPGVLREGRTLGRVLLSGALPLLVYAYLPVSSALGSPFDASHPTTVKAFLDLVTARAWAGDMLYFDPLSGPRLELGRQILLTNFGAAGLLLAAVGGVATLLVRPRWALLTGAIGAINLYVGLSYRAPVIADYLIPTYLVMALWIGGLAALPGLPRPRLAAVGAILGALLLGPPVLYARDNWASFDLSGDRADEAFLRDSFALAAPDATILTDWYHSTILEYGQLARGERPDLRVDYVAPEGNVVPWLNRARAVPGRGPVYATGLDAKLGGAFHLQRVGPLYRVLASPSTELPAGLTPSGIRFGDAIELIGYRLDAPPRGADVTVTLAWRARQPVGRDVSEFVHVADPSGRVWGQRDGTPGEGLYPTSRWQVGEVIIEGYDFAVASTAPADDLWLELGFYETLPAGGWKRFDARGPDGQALGDAPRIARLALQPRAVPRAALSWPEDTVRRALPRLVGDGAAGGPRWAARQSGPLAVPFGHRALLTGWALDRADARPGDSLRVALDFRAVGAFPEDAAVFVHLVDRTGRMRAQRDSVPVDGGLPTLRWAPGRPVRDVRVIAIPQDLPPGEYRLRVGMYVMSTGAHLPILDDELAKAGQGDFVGLTTLTVRP